MNRDLAELSDLTAASVDPAQITNTPLRKILTSVRTCVKNEFLFRSRHHKDVSYTDQADGTHRTTHTDQPGHMDHTEHRDAIHTYNEHYDTHEDATPYLQHSETVHTDKV